jgi:dTDP-4-amino-4,6-dideoxygalactose transaminase
MSKLALAGGSPVRTRPFPAHMTIGNEERRAVLEVMESGVLSQFLGSWGEEFYGGPRVRSCEQMFAQRFDTRYAISVNSATTGLQVALAAAGIEPGDEVIVPPYTMSATAATIVAQNAIPVFADVEDQTYGLDPASVAKRITEHTRAIVVVHLFGHPARMDGLLELAERHDLAIVEDAAQAVGATWHEREAGTMGVVGVLSLNYHKIIHCGEGGIVLADDPKVARIVQMVRNHGEVVVDDEGGDPFNTLGSNFRLTEIEAAIASVQLQKLDELLAIRRRLAARLTSRLEQHVQLIPAQTAPGCTSSHYAFPIRLQPGLLEIVDRCALARALRAEGIPVTTGYVKPIYLQPLYQQRLGRGRRGCPWTCGHWTGTVSYEHGICPVTERLWEQELMLLDVCRAPLTERDADDVADAFEKLLGSLDELRMLAGNLT